MYTRHLNRNGHSHIQSSNTVSVVVTHIGTVCYKIAQKDLFSFSFLTNVLSSETKQNCHCMPLVFTESFCLSLFLLATVEHKFVSKLKKEEPDCGLS